jgi:hypothetical protein
LDVNLTAIRLELLKELFKSFCVGIEIGSTHCDIENRAFAYKRKHLLRQGLAFTGFAQESGRFIEVYCPCMGGSIESLGYFSINRFRKLNQIMSSR